MSLRTFRILPTQMDLIVRLPRFPGDLRHPMIELMEIDFGHNSPNVTRHQCSLETTALPSFLPEIGLHGLYPFTPAYDNEDPTGFLKTMMTFGTVLAFHHIQFFAKRTATDRGWNLIHTARHEGGEDGGPQVQHLVQNPQTLECLLTFQATRSLKDWKANFDFIQVKDFCGLSNMVHRGFRNHLRSIIYSDDWQSNIRPKLPSCAKVYAAGASLGGATAELFTACVQHAPKPENDPEGDYAKFGWTKGVAKLLPPL